MILIVAFSARMLAELAVRAGHEVTAVDHFGDVDLRRACPSVSVPGGMAELVAAAERIPASRVVYGAGLENRPDLVARLAAGRELLGCPPDVLRRVRDPAQLAGSGLPYPRTFVGRVPPAGRWLRKPLRSGGGRGVRPWRGEAVGPGVVVQERIEGLPCSAVAVAGGLLGVSEQLIGRFGARGFTWSGNLVPPRLPADERRALGAAAEAICARVAEAFGVRGLFGVDMVWDGERAWVVEVNPRPSGSLEVIAPDAFAAHLDGAPARRPEPAGQPPAVPAAGRPQAGATAGQPPAVPAVGRPPAGATAGHLPAGRPPAGATAGHAAAGKAVVFAREDVVVPDLRGPDVRDVPHPGERIARGRPICTLVATGATPESVLAELETRAAALPVEAHALV
ncbi:MAG TPA: ATP-grasp domain-containing protein [Solirubrobacteraceae bacterium]